MKNLFHEFFYIPKHGRIREKVMVTRVVVAVTVIVTCLIAMSITAYAYFSHDVSSGKTLIKAADYKVTAIVKPANNLLDSVPLEIAPDEFGAYTLEPGAYFVQLDKSGEARTGFCIMSVSTGGTETEYHTHQIGVDGAIERLSMQFTLELTEASTVQFTPCWGTSSYYGKKDVPCYIAPDTTVTVGAVVETPENEEQTQEQDQQAAPEEELDERTEEE